MRTYLCLCLVALIASTGLGELPKLPVDDQRLSISTLVREDIFAGWRAGNTERLGRAERNLEKLLESRPDRRAVSLAWLGGVRFNQALLALESDNREEFERLYKETQALYSEATEIGAKDIVVAVVVGGGYAVLADRLPEEYQEEAWTHAFDGYQKVWAVQGAYVDKLPSHIGGELLAGIAQSAARLENQTVLDQTLDKIIEVLPETRYAQVAKEWKQNPESATTGKIICKSCHTRGRLAARIKAMEK